AGGAADELERGGSGQRLRALGQRRLQPGGEIGGRGCARGRRDSLVRVLGRAAARSASKKAHIGRGGSFPAILKLFRGRTSLPFPSRSARPVPRPRPAARGRAGSART